MAPGDRDHVCATVTPDGQSGHSGPCSLTSSDVRFIHRVRKAPTMRAAAQWLSWEEAPVRIRSQATLSCAGMKATPHSQLRLDGGELCWHGNHEYGAIPLCPHPTGTQGRAAFVSVKAVARVSAEKTAQ